MEQEKLIALIEKLRNFPREQSTLEFKSNLKDPKEIAQYISALGNSAALERHDRAWMVWGIDDSTHAVTGTQFDPSKTKGEGNQSLIMWLTQKILPRPDFKFHEVPHPDGRVILLEIHPPRSAPLAFQGERYIRVDSHKTKLSEHQDKERRLWAMLDQNQDWSGEIVPEATWDDLDPEALEVGRRKFMEFALKNERDQDQLDRVKAQLQEMDNPTLLNKAHITKQGRITRAALLLLGKDEASHLLSPVDAKITWLLRDAHNRTIDSQHFGPPMLLSTEKVANRIRNIMVEYMPDQSLFPTAVQSYDPWVIREALHNCLAHQDYLLHGKINVVEHPDRLVFSNQGQFLPPSVEWMLETQSPPEHYRNQWLINGMIRLRMIDQAGSGIRRMFETQRQRFFPLPDYVLSPMAEGTPRVQVTISGQVLDINYTRLLMSRDDLDLKQVLLLDKVQKKEPISAEEAKTLRKDKLIEGRSPNFFVSAEVAAWTKSKATYIRNRGMDDTYYHQLILGYLEKYGQASRQELDDLLLPKMPDVLDSSQKANKVRNLTQSMRRKGLIHSIGARSTAVWRRGPG